MMLSSLLSDLDDGKVDEMENIVSELTEISDSVHFTTSDLETDSDGEFKLIFLFLFLYLIEVLAVTELLNSEKIAN